MCTLHFHNGMGGFIFLFISIRKYILLRKISTVPEIQQQFKQTKQNKKRKKTTKQTTRKTPMYLAVTLNYLNLSPATSEINKLNHH